MQVLPSLQADNLKGSHTLGMIGMSLRPHFGWKPIPRNPIPISSATAFTYQIAVWVNNSTMKLNDITQQNFVYIWNDKSAFQFRMNLNNIMWWFNIESLFIWS